MTSANREQTLLPPQPVIAPETAFFWEGLRERQLRIQRCADCGTLRHPPGPICLACRSLRWDNVQSCGQGTLVAMTVVHQPQLMGFDYPLKVGIIALQEGTRIVVPLRGSSDALFIGASMQVQFQDCDDGLRMPYFIASSTSNSN